MCIRDRPFFVACDKFIYIEILKAQEEETEEVVETTSAKSANGKSTKTKTRRVKKTKKKTLEKVTPKVIRLISATIADCADEDGWAFLGDVGALLQKKQPNFDTRNYGFLKLTPLINSMGRFEIERRENQKGRLKLIYVRKKGLSKQSLEIL